MGPHKTLDWIALLRVAVTVGVSPSEFWDMTPAETVVIVEQRAEAHRRTVIQTAWLTARLSRAKRVPALKRLLDSPAAKPLSGEELVKRRTEFAEMTAKLDVDKIVAGLRKSKNA